jgi:AraC-like DNA-binding protein
LPWSVERLAELANMSRTKFAALFNEVMDMTPMAYVTAWRMKVAQDLLREGKPIKVIADAVGYGSQASFSRSFAQQVGQPPGEWLRGEGQIMPAKLQVQIYRDEPGQAQGG